MKKLFICYRNEDHQEVKILVDELRIRGIDVWIDKDYGFKIGDITPSEARRVIQDDCFGLLLYATPEVFVRPFIKKIELDEAIRRKDENPDFLLIALPVRMDFSELTKLGQKEFGIDMSLFHSYAIHDIANCDNSTLHSQLSKVANMILIKILDMAKDAISNNGFIGIHLNTKEREPVSLDDILNVDWTEFLENIYDMKTDDWKHLLDRLRDIKRCISQELGRPKIRLLGRKHFSAAFMFGRIFPSSSGFELETRQGDSWWTTKCNPIDNEPFRLQIVDGTVNSDSLFVEIAATEKLVRDAVRRYEIKTGTNPLLYLRFVPQSGPKLRAVVNNNTCCAMALQIRTSIADILSKRPIKDIHLFGSMPNGLAVMIGHHMNASPPIQLYEYDGTDYYPSCQLDSMNI
jgi:hypothetical protein